MLQRQAKASRSSPAGSVTVNGIRTRALAFTLRMAAPTSELTSAFMYAPREEVTGQSLFAQLGAPPTTTDTIGMRQYELGIAYQRRF